MMQDLTRTRDDGLAARLTLLEADRDFSRRGGDLGPIPVPTAGVRGAAGWLGLAAAPTFALLALVSGVVGGGAPDVVCAAMRGPLQLGGMVPMYLAMSLFHAAPWLDLLTRRRSAAGRP